MKAFTTAIVSLFACTAVATSPPSKASETSGQARAEAAGQGMVGSHAPGFVLTTIDGEKIDLGQLYGKKAVYLKFWATWCVPCREQMPHFERTYRSAGKDLAVIAINIGFDDSLQDVREYRKRLGITMPIVIDDGRLGSAFNLRVTPQHVVIGRDGRIQYVGHLADQSLEAALLAARTSDASNSQAHKVSLRQDPAHHAVGDRLPDLAVTTVDGASFNLLDSRPGRPTVLVFLSPWCESYLADSRPTIATSCRQVREQVDALAKGQPQLRWLGVASGIWATKDELSDYRTKYNTAIPMTLDESGQLFRSFRVMKVPTVLMADAAGRIVGRVEGFDVGLPAQVQALAGR
jgi:thiol-disulfide isomerase/thioredoxin